MIEVGPVTGREKTKKLKTLILVTNGAGLPATKNIVPNNNGASFTETRIPLTEILNHTIETEVQNTIYYKDETEVRISLNGLVLERDFVIWMPVRYVIT